MKDAEGVDSLLSIVQMPAGVPVGMLAIIELGAGWLRVVDVFSIARSQEVR